MKEIKKERTNERTKHQQRKTEIQKERKNCKIGKARKKYMKKEKKKQERKRGNENKDRQKEINKERMKTNYVESVQLLNFSISVAFQHFFFSVFSTVQLFMIQFMIPCVKMLIYIL